MTTGRQATLVLGMHRSGTSAVTGLLVRSGLQAPKTLLPADERNAEGYWESSVLNEFHDRLLRAAGTRWDGYTRIDPEWFRSEVAGTFADECRARLKDEFGDARSLVLKDPRICRLVPFWLRVLEAEGIDACAVLVLRHPFAVAASLAERNGFPHRVSLLLWLRHVLDSEKATRSMPRGVVGYDDVVANWRGAAERLAAQVGPYWSGSWAPDAEAIDCSVRQDLRHHQRQTAAAMPLMLKDWIDRSWAALTALAGGRGEEAAAAQRALDGVREEFDRSVTIFGLDAEQQRVQREDRIAWLEEQLADLRTQLGSLRDHAARLQSDRSALEADRAELRSSLSWRVTAPLRALGRMVR